MRKQAKGMLPIMGAALSLGLSVLLTPTPSALAQDKPRYGGELVFAVPAEPPSFDAHRENTFAVIHPISPHYSLLLRVDPEDPNKIIGDLAESWAASRDGLTYTFKIRKGVKFHDGSLLTAKDIKATYDKIIFPPAGVASERKGAYAAVEVVEAPDAQTVRFRLKWPSAAMLSNLASPWNYIYKAEILAKDPHWYEKNVMGTGPFKFVEYVRGSHWVGKKNPDYWDKGRPYLDGYRALFIRDTGARVAAVRGERAFIEFRSFNPARRDDLVKALGPKITVQESAWDCALWFTPNHEKKPFDDPRVRRALTLALDRWEGSKVLSKITIVKEVGGVLVPGSPLATPEAEVVKLAGYWKDAEASRKEARRLLKEAGVPEGFSFTFLNRAIPEPYEPLGIWLLDQWRKVGLNVTQKTLETGPFYQDLRGGNFDVSIDFQCGFIVEPDLDLYKFQSGPTTADPKSLSDANYGRYKDPVLDELYVKQSRALDPEERKKYIRQFEKRLLDEQAHMFITLWWHRIIPHNSKVKGWKITPSHYLNQQLDTVWLAE